MLLEHDMCSFLLELEKLPIYPIEALNEEINIYQLEHVVYWMLTYRSKQKIFKSDKEKEERKKMEDDLTKIYMIPGRMDQ